MEFAQIPDKDKIFRMFALFRWGAILLILVTILHLKFIANFEIPLHQALVVIALGALFNVFYGILFPSFKLFNTNAVFTYFAGTTDFIFITLLIHYTGGIESPLLLLYLLELVAATVFGFTELSYLLAIEATLFYGAVSLLEAQEIIPHYSMTNLYSSLFLNVNYIFSMAFAIMITCLLLIMMTSRLTKMISQKQKEIERLSQAQIDFMHEVMHETKSPLTSILGYTEILLKGTFGQPTDEQGNFLNIIMRQSKRLLNMTNNLLDLARLKSGKVPLELKESSLKDLSDRAIEEMKPSLDEKKLEMNQEIGPGIPQVQMDEPKVLEVLINLVSNAIKFSKEGGKINLAIQAQPGEIEFSICDEGLGITPEDLPYIFEKFHRGSKEAGAVRGTGLGLALSKTIIEAHGGRMWAESAGRNQGSTFHFTLPL